MDRTQSPTMRSPLAVSACCLLVALALAAGCGNSNSSPEPGGAPGGGPPQSAGGAGKIRLTYWVTPEVKDLAGMEAQTPEFGDYEKIQAAEYTKDHPEVEIEVQALASEELTKKVTTAIASGSPPDVLKDYLGRTSGYAHQDLLEDFTSVVSAADRKDYDPFYLEQYTINGKLHGLPTYAWLAHMAVNRAIWEAAGKADLLPKEADGSWTYDQFLTALRAVARKDSLWPFWAQFASEQGDYGNLAFFWGHGAFLYTGGDYSKITLNTPAGVKGLDFLVQMAREGLIPPGATTMASSELENMVGKGQTAAWGDSLYVFHRIEIAQKEKRIQVPVKLQIVQYPHAPGLKSPLPVGPTGFVVFKQKDARRRDAAIAFAQWLNQTKFQEVTCQNIREYPTRLSARPKLEKDPNFRLVQKWAQENGKADLGLTASGYYKVRVAAIPHFQAAILGQKTAAQALADYEKEANQILADQKH